MEVEREVVVTAVRDEVWTALTDPGRLAEWFANEVELDLRPGGEGVFRWADGEVRRARVERVEAGRELVFRWYDDEAEDAVTTVAFTLEDDAEGTRVTVRESFAAIEASAAPAGEWVWAIQLFAFLLELARAAVA